MKIAIPFLLAVLWGGGAMAETEPPPEAPFHGSVTDPTKVTPAFEKSYRELAAQTQPTAAGGVNPPAAPKLPEVRLLGRISGKNARDGAVTLQVGKETMTIRAGGESTINHDGLLIRVTLEDMNEQAVRVRLSGHSEPFILH